MKLFLPFVLITTLCANAQNKGCGMVKYQDYIFEKDPLSRIKTEQLLRDADEPLTGNTNARPPQAPTYIIPVVFHVLHMNGPETISDAQIQNQVAILNRDFRKQNQDTLQIMWQFQGIAADCNIEFRLATIDEDGKCTNGITRHYDANTNWVIDYDNYIYTWDHTKYLNFYVVRNMPPGVAAYANYPGVGPAFADVIVTGHEFVGSIGTGNAYTSRALTHEVGHWLNLQHLWGNTNNPGVACGNDGVNDTPVTEGYTWCNLNNTINCTQGVVENIQNYMDYAYCSLMFTQGQRTRMHNALNSPVGGRNNVWSPANLLATGVTNPLYNCAPKAEFNYNITNTVVCTGSSFMFYDQSYNAPITSWQWSSPQASNISILQNGQLTFTSAGPATVKLKVSNSFGSDSITKQIVTVLSNSVSPGANYSQGFETTFPDNLWMNTTPADGVGFIQNSVGASFNGFNCGWVDNFYNSPNVPVAIFTPGFNLQNVTAAQLSFYFAYVPKTNSGFEMLNVYASTNCGTNWSQVYQASGATLNTKGGILDEPFQNPQFEEWEQVIINLNTLLGNPSVHFKFEFTPSANAPGNNLFIDDINLTRTLPSGVGINEAQLASQKISVAPNPFSQKLTVSWEGINKDADLKLFDVSGRELKIQKTVKDTSIELDTEGGLAKGVYFIQVNVAGERKVLKVVHE